MTANAPETEIAPDAAEPGTPEDPAEPETTATSRKGSPAHSKWRRRTRSTGSKVLFTVLATALCVVFLLPLLYAISQSLSDPAASGTPGSPWYPSIQRSYLCPNAGLCTFQSGIVDGAGNFKPLGDPIDMTGRSLPVFNVPHKGELALLQVNNWWSGLPCRFIDPKTNARIDIVMDSTTLVPVWDFHITWDNYSSVFGAAGFISKGGFGTWLLNSSIIASLSAIGAVVSAVLVAYGFARFKFRGRDVLFLVLIGTVLIPYQVTMIPQYIVYHTMGWDASFLPLTVPNFFGNAYYIFLLRQYFMTLPRELDEAAMVDGASHFRILTQIIVPQAWPAIAAVALFQFLFSWNDFYGALIYLFSWDQLTPVSLGLSFLVASPPAFFESAALISLALPLVLALLAQRAFMRGIVISGVEK